MTSPTPAPRAAEPATDELARFCIIFDETFGTRYTRLAAALKDYVSRHPPPSATAEDEVVREREACAELADDWDRRGDRHSAGRLRSALAAMEART